MKNRSLPLLLANFAVTAVGSLVLPASGRENPDAFALEQEYTKEQAEIDLAMAEIMFKAVNGESQQSEVQHETDKWLHAHTARLTAQVERAAILDSIDPLPPDEQLSPEPAIQPAFRNTDMGSRYQALERQESKAFAQCEQLAQSPQHRQELLDEWAHGKEGRAILAEKKDIWIQFASDLPVGTDPVILEVSEEAPLEEVEALDWQESSVRRIMDIRQANPNATPSEMQFLIDLHRQNFIRDELQVARLMEVVRRRKLKDDVLGLRAEAARSDLTRASPAKKSHGRKTGAGEGINNIGNDPMHPSGTP